MPAALIDETGNTYGSLTVLKPIRTPEMRKTMWLCECSCGEQKIFNGSELRAGKRTSCGKNCNNIKREKPGTIYGYLKVLEQDSLKDEYCSNNKISRLYFNHSFKGRFSGSYEEIKKEIQLFYEEIKEKKGYVKVLNYDF